MSFVGNMFNSAQGAGFRAQTAPLDQVYTQQQIDQAYNNTQTGLSQQQAFVNALQAQNGIQNQSNVYNQLQNVAQGQGPNPARAMLAQAAGNTAAQQAALMGSQRGAGANAGLIARQAAQLGAQQQQAAAGQAATLQAQQSLGALGQMGGLATQQVGQQQQGIGAYNQFAQGQQQNLLGAAAAYNQALTGQQNAINAANAGIAGINTQSQAQLLGGVLSGASSAAGAFAQGGMVPSYADGGDVDPLDTNTPKSSAGKFFQNFSKGMNTSNQSAPMFQAGSGAAQAIGQGIGAGIRGIGNLFSSQASQPYQTPQDIQMQGLDMSQPLPPVSQAVGSQNDFVPPLAHGGMPKDMKQGGKVPGVGKVSGDSYVNDTVPAMLSPKEIVIPRSIAMHPQAGELAKHFVENELKKNKHYADGGTVKDANSPTININVPQAQGPQPLPESVNVNPNFMKGQQFAKNTKSPENQFAEEYQPKYTYDPQGTMPQAQPQKVGPQNYPLQSLQPTQDNSISNKLPTAEEIEKPVTEQMTGIQEEAAAKGALGQRQAQAANQFIAQQQAQQKVYQDSLKNNMADINATVQDYKAGHIDPSRYLASQNVGQKIATAIGLVLGGIGGALTHQENPAMKFLQTQIDRDIESQKAELGKKENLLSVNFRKFGNMQDAVKMTQAMQHGIYAAQFEKAAALAQTPIEKARAMQAAAQLQSQILPTLQQIRVRNTLLGQNASQNTQKIDPAIAARFLAPDESTRKEAVKEAGEYKSLVKAQETLFTAFNQLDKLNTIGNRIQHLGRTPAAVESIKGRVLPGLSKETAGRFTEADAKYIESILPENLDTPATIAQKKQDLYNLIAPKFEQFGTLSSLGIPTPPVESPNRNPNVIPNYNMARR